MDVWTCTTCGKRKDLSGDHLKGKNTVRSDCWPCAKKSTFVRGNAKATNSTTTPATTNTNANANSTNTTTNASGLNPFAVAAAAFAKTPFAGIVNTQKNSTGSSSLLSTTTTTTGQGALNETTQSNTLSSSGNTASVVMQSFTGSVDAGMAVWTCTTCGKRKELSGDHLKGKNTVRSDCWPCAKKSTFVRGNTKAANSTTTPVVTAPFLFNSAAKTSPEKTTTTTTPSNTNTNTNTNSTNSTTNASGLNPFAVAAAAFAKTPFAGTVNTQKNSTGSNSLLSTTPTTTGQGAFNATTQSNTLSSSGNTSPIIMQSFTGPNNKTHHTPPFAFTTSPNAVMPSMYTDPSAVDSGKPVWTCTVCGKRKELSGDHLKGKNTVRSDCWPCAKKRTFIFCTPESFSTGGLSTMLPRSRSSASVAAAAAGGATTTTTTTTGNESQREVSPTATVTSLGVSPMQPITGHWQDPVVPENDAAMNMFLIRTSTAQLGEKGQRVSQSPASPEVDQPSHAITFEGEVLRGYRRQLVDGIRTRTAWNNRTLYVLAPENNNNNNNNNMTQQNSNNTMSDASLLGAAAVVFLAIEHKLAQSPFRVMRRLFCPDEFSFAAACLYVNTFLDGHHSSEGQPAFVVYGPRVDHTVPATRWGAVIDGCEYARQWVVSGEQRVEGAQGIFRHTGWLTLPLYATAEAIRCVVQAQEEEEKEEREKKKLGEKEGGEEMTYGVDVVLVKKTMNLEELPQAAALALPVRPF